MSPAAPVRRRAAAALIDLSVIIGGEVVGLIVGGSLLRAAGGGRIDTTAATPGVAGAIIRALLQAAIYLGPPVYLYVTWRRGATSARSMAPGRAASAASGSRSCASAPVSHGD